MSVDTMHDRIPGGGRTGRDATEQSATVGRRLRAAAGRAVVATFVVGAGSGVASAAPAGGRGVTPLQTEGIPLVGPTVVLVVALVVGVALRALERSLGPMGTWGGGADPADERVGRARGESSASAASRTAESSIATADPDRPSGGPSATPAATSDAGSDRDGIRHARGTFQTASGGGTLMVTSPGFEPDLVFLTGASRGPASSTGFAEGWSHGIAHRKGTGDVDQYAVSAADTGPGSAGGGIREDAALDLPISADGAGSDAVWGKVASTVDEGFQFEVSTPSGHDRTTTVQYHAVSLPDVAEASIGTFGFGSEPRKGKIDLGVDADYVSLTATTGARPLTRSRERPVAVSHGTVVHGAGGPGQASIGGTVDVDGGCYGAREGRAIHLVHPDGEDVAGRTSMRVTALGRTMRIELEEIHEAAPVAFAVYAAVSTPGDTPAPTAGMVTAPGPEKGARERVPTGFTPGVVGFAASAGAVGNEDRRVAEELELLGWSHGVVDGTPGGMAGSIPLRSLGPDGGIVDSSMGMGIDDDGFVLAAMEDVEDERPSVLYTAWPGESE